jgi:hypothetical protein
MAEHDRDGASQLRAWAKGSNSLEAGVELLLRAFGGRFARPGWPWIRQDGQDTWVDFAAIASNLDGLSGGERRFLLLVASLTVGERIDLVECLGGLDRKTLALLLAGVAHAAGTHEQTESLPEQTAEGTEMITPWGPRMDLASLYPWPGDPESLPDRPDRC